MARQQARQQRQAARQSYNTRLEQGSKARQQGRQGKQEHNVAQQGSRSPSCAHVFFCGDAHSRASGEPVPAPRQRRRRLAQLTRQPRDGALHGSNLIKQVCQADVKLCIYIYMYIYFIKYIHVYNRPAPGTRARARRRRPLHGTPRSASAAAAPGQCRPAP